MSDPVSGASSPPVLQVFCGTAILKSVELDSQETVVASAISETQRLGFELSGRESEVEYRIRLGNVEELSAADVNTGAAIIVMGRTFSRLVCWEESAYLESGRGRTALFVESRSIDSGRPWRLRATVNFVVLPTKLGELRYQRMLEELAGLAAGLVLDLVSKSRISLDFVSTPLAVFTGSGQLELRTLERTWRRIAAALEDIQREPTTAITRRPTLRHCWGPERLSYRGIRRLASVGTDIRRSDSPRPFSTVVEATEETTDTLEHRRIVAFLQLLEDRARECALSAERQIGAIERDRRFRESAPAGERSLYETVDLPRIRRLRDAASAANSLRNQVREGRQLAFLRGVRASPGPFRSPVFEHVAPYRRFRDAATAFARSSVVVLDEGEEDQLKSTSRMYEQWLLLQLVAALRDSGLQVRHSSHLIRQVGRQRFTLDIERGTHIEFRSQDGRIVAVRYEPWILPREIANGRRDTVYRGRGGAAPWSPDILIEVMLDDAAEGVPNTVTYGIVIDAKYSRNLRDEQWESARKYLEIKSTRTDRQVVYQAWLAHPGQGSAITFPDSDLAWGPSGPNLPLGDRALGRLSIVPEIADPASDLTDIHPTEQAREFVRGLLAYLSFEEALAAAPTADSIGWLKQHPAVD